MSGTYWQETCTYDVLSDAAEDIGSILDAAAKRVLAEQLDAGLTHTSGGRP